MTKVGEHVTLDIIGTEKDYEPKFFEKLVFSISKTRVLKNYINLVCGKPGAILFMLILRQ